MNRILTILLACALALAACSAPAPSGGSQPPLPAASVPAPEPEPGPQPQPEPDPEPEPPPVFQWRTEAPEEHQMDPEVLDHLHRALAGSSVYAMVTVKDGVIIDEYYQPGRDENSVFDLHACSKSFTSALLGIAIQEGYIGGVDDLLSDYLPQAARLEGAKKELTLRHLLTHTSGLEWYEWGGGASNWSEFRRAENWVDYILGRRLVARPGERFNYSTGNTHLLAAAIEAATGKGLLEYGKEALFDRMGMASITWGADPQGIADGGNGVSVTARDAARFGQLFLQGGVWEGEQLVPADWVKESTTAQNNGAGDGTGSYGYQWWVRSFTANGYGTYAAPHGAGKYDCYYAFGAWGQFILVVPELQLVTVIASAGPQNSYAPRPYFTDYILSAYTGGTF